MRKGLILGIALAALVFITTSIPAHAGFSVRFYAGAPLYRAPRMIVRPPVVVPPPVVIGPPGVYHTPRYSPPHYAPRPTYIPGRWHWSAWGWQWLPGYWIQ